MSAFESGESSTDTVGRSSEPPARRNTAPAVAAPPSTEPQSGSRTAVYVWFALILAVAGIAVGFGWHAQMGPTDPTLPGTRMGPTSAMLNSAVLVFREGLECILVLAAVTASFRAKNQPYRRPVALGGVVGLAATAATWFVVIWLIGLFGGTGLQVQAATGIPAIIVLLVVMNWFFHKIYWTGWISHHNKRRRNVVGKVGSMSTGRVFLGLGLLGLTSVYREGFEVVIFLQALREKFDGSVVAQGVILGLLFTAAVGVLTFAVHANLPYKKMLIITGGLLVVVLWVMVGEEINEMQLAGWIDTTAIPGLHLPDWAGTWFSAYSNVETFVGQGLALLLVGGSYVAAQVKGGRRRIRGRPRRRTSA